MEKPLININLSNLDLPGVFLFIFLSVAVFNIAQCQKETNVSIQKKLTTLDSLKIANQETITESSENE